MFKMLTAISLTSIMVLSETAISFAEESNQTMNIIRGSDESVEITEIDQRVVDVCNGKAYHEMKSCGSGRIDLLDGSTFILRESAYQCTRCHKV